MPTNPNADPDKGKLPLLESNDFESLTKRRRIFITATLEPSSGDPRIQPTGFPDLGPVLYPDPAGKHGLICLIESEASMANRLEEVCLDNKYEGTLREELTGLPYVKLTSDGTLQGAFVTASTIDGHRFASEYIMGGHLVQDSPELQAITTPPSDGNPSHTGPAQHAKGAKKRASSNDGDPEFVRFVQKFMGMATKDRCPAANVPRVFRLAMEYDPLSLLHGFQISVKNKLTFVGLRSPRAITASILGLGCQRITVPGVRIDPIGTGDAGQAIFQKLRISANRIEARFCIDVGLLASMPLGGADPEQANARRRLLVNIALCKVAWFLGALRNGLRLRTDCDLRTMEGPAHYWLDRIGEGGGGKSFNFESISDVALGLANEIAASGLDVAHSPLLLKHVARAKDGKGSDEGAKPGPDDSGGVAESQEESDD